MSYTANSTTICGNASGGQWVAWAGQIISLLSAGASNTNLITGQVIVNTPLVGNVPNGANQDKTIIGYQINDGFTGLPFYFTFTLGSGSSTQFPAMSMAVGSSLDGSGNLGNSSPVLRHAALANTAANVGSYFALGTGRLSFAQWVSNSANNATPNTSLIFGFERTRDINGNTTNDGVILTAYSANQGFKQCIWNPNYGFGNNAYTAVESRWGVMGPSVGTTGRITGAQYALYPLMYSLNGPLCTGLNFLAAYDGDFAVGSNVSVTLFGVKHNYKAIGNVVTITGRPGNLTTLMRFE